jgi:antitoxin component of MazEF toxin-antitoxin module
MTSISSDYSSLSPYAGNSLSSLLSSTPSNTSTDDDDSSAGVSKDTDTVTLSAEALAAANRESIGLPATGKLILSDFETAATQGEETVNTLLASAMEELGIDADQQVSLSLNSNNKIEIKNTFTRSDALEDMLNANSEFTQSFTALTASNEILDFTEYLQEKVANTSLADYINKETSDADLLSLAAEYSAINAASGSLETLWSISHEATPYTYEYNEYN